ncbi:MAG: metallophosphoesterase [Marmoricola sp.]|nr:metallophosphoesterase [Marmoricola sp.]
MRKRWLRVAVGVAVWLVVTLVLWPVLFTHTSARTVVASHDAVVNPTLDGHVRLDMGPYLPDVRFGSGQRIGVFVDVGKTTATSGSELAERYATIAAHPAAETERLSDIVSRLALDSALRAALLGLVPIALWVLVGARRRAELLALRPRTLGAAAVGCATVIVLLVQPWHSDQERVEPQTWLPIEQALPDLTVPRELRGWQLEGGFFTTETRRLVQSAFDTYAVSKVFYGDVVKRVPEVKTQLHAPGQDETVALLVSDRHDNIGMDAVARAIGDAGGARVVIDAGDDTSTGAAWESFSLNSLDKTFKGYDERIAISGNHDNGTFVSHYLEKRGWTHLDGAAIEPFAGVRLTGVDDPRSSGLGSWRDAKGLSFDQATQKIADDVCADDTAGKRISTLVVHSASMGATALQRGCVDLVVGGHLHVQVGPTRVVGANGKAGYSYTNGTTGGAAYSMALGSKLRRDAEVTLLTFAHGRPTGIQPVTIRTTGDISVAPYVPLDLG